MEQTKRKLVVLVTGSANVDRPSLALTLANTSLSAGMDVLVFLGSDGADLARDGAANLCHVRPFRPLEDLMEEFTKGGGTLAACGSCLQFRGIEDDQIREGVQVAGMATLASWLAAGAQTVNF